MKELGNWEETVFISEKFCIQLAQLPALVSSERNRTGLHFSKGQPLNITRKKKGFENDTSSIISQLEDKT